MTKEDNEYEQKFTVIYKSYVDEIYGYVYLHMGLNTELASDMTQDIFVAVYTHLKGFKGLCSIRTWIYRITHNKLIDFYRRSYSRSFETVELDEVIDLELADTGQDIQEKIISDIQKEMVHNCLKEIPPQYAVILIWKYMDNYSTKEIAGFMGKSPKAVESMLQRAKKTFIHKFNMIKEHYE